MAALAPSLTPVVFQLAAGLEQYEMDLRDLLACAGRKPADPKRYARVVQELARIQKLSGALPQLAADTVEVVMRHVELVGLLFASPMRYAAWRQRKEILALQLRLGEVIASMRTKCLRLLAREEGVTPAV
jgi:hypothetical protein